MNRVEIMGRLTREPDVRYSTGENPIPIARFNMAVDRKTAKQEQRADYINCIAFGKRAEFAEKYMHKGGKFLIGGHIQTGSYEKDGRKVYMTDVVVDEVYFCDAKKEKTVDDFVAMDEELPFK